MNRAPTSFALRRKWGFPNRYGRHGLSHPAQIQLTGVLIRLALKVVGS
jgi:hypothetical protein